jgi:hypothetical protein
MKKHVVVIKSLAALAVVSMLSWLCRSQVPSEPRIAPVEQPVFRSPFVLKLHVDDERSYEERFNHVPYVAEDEVYLFAGESFGINTTLIGNRLSKVRYQPDPAKADVEFKFSQEKSQTGFMMLLVIKNRLKRRISPDALMTVPGDKDVHQTDVLPVGPGRSNTESWPHPIVQLMLRNFRFSEKPKEQTETVDPKTGNVHLTTTVAASRNPKQ